MKYLILTLGLFPAIIFAQTTNLLISEYGEGSGGNKKYIEIYNGTGASVDLSNYQLWKNVNGSAWNMSSTGTPTTPLSLTGILLNNDTYVIGHNTTDVIGADLYSTFLAFNGDDAIGLAWNGGAGTTFSLIDVFGTELIDPGTSWSIAGNLTGAVDKILIRKPTICSPTTNWTLSAGTDVPSSQWIIEVDPYNATSQTTNLGLHTANCILTCNTFSTIDPTVCTSYTVPSGDETYFTSGTYMDTIPNAALCDSILTINLTITTGITYYADGDSDGFGNPAMTTVACSLPVGYVTNSDDCDDSNNAIGVATTTFYQDSDGDTFGSATATIVACTQPVGYVSNSLDCNDANNAINPNAIDIPDNGIDEDCSGSDASILGSDLGMYEFTQAAACPVTALDVTTQPLNAVFSPYSTMNTSCQSTANVFNNSDWNITAVVDPTEYNEFSVNANDCYTIDINRIIFTHKNSASGGFPTWTLRSSLDNFATDVASGLSSSFDKIDTINLTAAFDAIDQVTFRFYVTNISTTTATWRNDNVRVIGTFGTLTPQTYYADVDGDTYGDPTSTISVCTPPVGYVLNNTDCDDNNAAINPTTVWYQDLDNDTYGNSAVMLTNCTQPVGYVATAGDCDDLNNAVYQTTTYYIDLDIDGHGDASAVGVDFCNNPGTGYSLLNDDCDDTDNSVYPGATEICDGKDNDCANGIDDGLTFVNYYVDADNDTYGTGAPQSLCSNPGAGYSTQNGDCNDANASMYPGATEILNNGIDENCDGTDNYVGIDEFEKFQIAVQPNPSNGLITLVLNQETNGLIEVIDLNGKVQFSTRMIGTELQIDLSGISKGTYLLKFNTDSTVIQKRIVLQ